MHPNTSRKTFRLAVHFIPDGIQNELYSNGGPETPTAATRIWPPPQIDVLMSLTSFFSSTMLIECSCSPPFASSISSLARTKNRAPGEPRHAADVYDRIDFPFYIAVDETLPSRGPMHSQKQDNPATPKCVRTTSDLLNDSVECVQIGDFDPTILYFTDNNTHEESTL